MTVEEVTSDDFLEKVGPDTALLIVPGSRAGQAYRDELGRTRENRHDLHSEQFTPTLFAHLKSQVAGGMTLLGICAGGYVFSRDFRYTEYDPHTIEVTNVKEVTSEIGLVDVYAYGPDLRLYDIQPREQANPWTIYSAAAVSFDGIDGERQNIHMALSKGPSFVNLNTETCKTLAVYSDTGEAAIVMQRHGLGRVILCGPEPAIGGDNLDFYEVAEQYREDPRVLRIMHALESSHDGFGELWCKLLAEALPEEVYKPARDQVRRNLVFKPRARRMMNG